MRTFGAGGKPSVSLNAWNVADSGVSRLSRQRPRPVLRATGERPRIRRPRAASAARAHPAGTHPAWKHGLRTSIRRGLRGAVHRIAQRASGECFRRRSKPAAARAGDHGTQFAEAPLLNSQQLVLTFLHAPKSRNRWDSQTVEVAVKDRGVYLVEAVRGDLRAYTILMVSDMVMITKIGSGRIVNFVADRATGEPVARRRTLPAHPRRRKDTAETDANGFAELKSSTEARRPPPGGAQRRQLRRQHAGRLRFRAAREHWMGYIYTDRPVYRPGHTVHFKGSPAAANGHRLPSCPRANRSRSKFRTPSRSRSTRRRLTANANGTIHDEFDLPVGAALGNYSSRSAPATRAS